MSILCRNRGSSHNTLWITLFLYVHCMCDPFLFLNHSTDRDGTFYFSFTLGTVSEEFGLGDRDKSIGVGIGPCLPRSILYLLTLNGNQSILLSFWETPLLENAISYRKNRSEGRGGAQPQAEVGRSWLFIIKFQSLYSI